MYKCSDCGKYFVSRGFLLLHKGSKCLKKSVQVQEVINSNGIDVISSINAVQDLNNECDDGYNNDKVSNNNFMSFYQQKL